MGNVKKRENEKSRKCEIKKYRRRDGISTDVELEGKNKNGAEVETKMKTYIVYILADLGDTTLLKICLQIQQIFAEVLDLKQSLAQFKM
jgi:hypothetical protein